MRAASAVRRSCCAARSCGNGRIGSTGTGAADVQCPACRRSNPAGARFCGQCGAPLGAPSVDAASRPSVPDEDYRTERRRLTVMFCDLIDSTVLSTRMDPEDTHQILRQYHDLCAALIDQRDGYLAQRLGDGVLAYFGHPVAHEDDASRAIATALQIAADVTQLTPVVPLPDGHALGVRIGIHTGEVVTAPVGHGRTATPLALGDVPNIAARLQGLAPRNGVVVSESTHALARHDF